MTNFQSPCDDRRLENYVAYDGLATRAADVDRIASNEYFRVRKGYNDYKEFDEYQKEINSRYIKSKRTRSAIPRRKLPPPIMKHD